MIWTLRKLDDWIPFLMKESGLPGPRGNLELAYAVAEPRLFEKPKQVLQNLDKITAAMESADHAKDESFKVLRQGMGYCWSVAAAALPEAGKPLIEKWLDSPNKDINWMMKVNLKKNRLIRMDPDWVKTSNVRLR